MGGRSVEDEILDSVEAETLQCVHEHVQTLCLSNLKDVQSFELK